ncbi:MAG: hypothetical protein Q7T51_03340 [Candidatus Moranbacteria bacterium]|nr:hypothetical protein [Candidatus Moranbacteria bacterium]
MGKYDKIDFTKEIPFIRERCPHLNDEELNEAEELFREYIRLCFDIYEKDEKMYRKGGLTDE